MFALSLATLCAPGMALAQDKIPTYALRTSGTLLAQAETRQFEVYFPLGKATLNAEASTTIAQAAQEYQRTGQAKIAVRGHTDTSGNTAANQALSERRAKAVSDELIRLGVPADAITEEALGETDLAVPTAKGVREAKNRRVEIVLQQPPPPPPAPAPAPAPQVTEAPPPPPPEQPKRGLISIGPFYGFVTKEVDDGSSHLVGLNLSVDYAVLPWLGIGAEQAGFYNFGSEEHSGFAGRSVASLNFLFGHYSLGDMDVEPYLGGNFGKVYSKGIHDDLIAGPEVGVFIGPFLGKVAYDIPLNYGPDEGIVAVTLGYGFRF